MAKKIDRSWGDKREEKKTEEVSYEGASVREEGTTTPSSLAEMFSAELHKNEDKGKRIETIKELKEEMGKYDRNEGADFSNVNWGKLVKDKKFTEDMMIQFQIPAQQYYENFVKSHNVSDGLIRRMYYDFLGVFMLEWVPLKDRHRIFPELFEEK